MESPQHNSIWPTIDIIYFFSSLVGENSLSGRNICRTLQIPIIRSCYLKQQARRLLVSLLLCISVAHQYN